jgi:outer membrane lipoprotein SlyB
MKRLLLVGFIYLTGCASTQNQNTYYQGEAGKVRQTVFATIVDIRPIEIKGENTGAGALTGGLAGGVAGAQFGSGDGQVAALIAGALIGAFAGAAAEQAISDKEGLDITVTTEKGETLTVAQYFSPEDQRLEIGERVLVQTDGSYMRVLPAEHLPEAINRPKNIKILD